MIIHPKTHEAYELLHNGSIAFSRIEQQGIRIDTGHASKKKQYLTRKIERLENEFKESKFFRHWQHASRSKVNINSNPQLGNFLYNTKKITPLKFTDKNKPSVDDEALGMLHIPEIDTLLDIRKLKKLRDTYLEAFIRETVDGVIHPFFNLGYVRTYRGSSDRPNFQNMPKRDKESMEIVRGCVYPRVDHQLWEADFSGIEVRVAAAYHKDKTMLKYLRNSKSDMHGDLAKQLFIVPDFDKTLPEHNRLRQAAKNQFIFPQFYGDYYKNNAAGLLGIWGQLPVGTWEQGQGMKMPQGTLSDHLIKKGIPSYNDFVEHVRLIEKDFWSKRFPIYAQWKEDWYEAYQKNGYVDMLTGFRVQGVMRKNDVINYPVQGAAFHCLLWSLTELDKSIIKYKWDSRIIGQIHDSINLDVNPKEEKHLEEEIHKILSKDMPKHFDWINVPMGIDIDKYPINGSWTKTIKDLEMMKTI